MSKQNKKIKKEGKFFNHHPKFRYKFNVIMDFIDKIYIKFYLVYFGFIALLFFFSIYCSFPQAIQIAFGILITAFIAPISINIINAKSHKNDEILKQNSKLFLTLAEILISLLDDDNIKLKQDKFTDFIQENVGHINIYFSQSILELINLILEEQSIHGTRENQKKYIRKLLKKIRSAVGINDQYYDLKYIISSQKKS